MMLYEMIQITDEDISWVEGILGGGIVFDESRRDVIKDLSSIDIQACPGSGKTTVLVAKLAILAKKWPYTHKGICVLSHTNVAREIIQARLGETEVGRKLLRFPHFIGTIQSFLDVFIAMPWIKSKGLPITVIDREIVLQKRWRKLQFGARSYLENKRKDESICEAKSIPVVLDIGCGETTATYKNLLSVINESHARGEFTFGEMVLYANDAISNNLSFVRNVQNRFTIVFIDEAQDTSSQQWEILNKLFMADDSQTILQGFGDENQAIYMSFSHSEQGDFFPRTARKTICNSKRFGDKIASFAHAFATDNADIMRGENMTFQHNNDKNTIFLFDITDIDKVVSAYAKHILDCFTDEEFIKHNELGCFVVGMVHKSDGTGAGVPKSICDYWSGYNPDNSPIAPKPQNLIGYFRIGRELMAEHGELGILLDWIARGIIRYILRNTDQKISIHLSAFSSLINKGKENSIIVREKLKEIVNMGIGSEIEWNEVKSKVINLCNNYFEVPRCTDTFLNWGFDTGTVIAGQHEKKFLNSMKYVDEESGRSVVLNFGSIHSVKGRTHLTTMAVETFWYNDNITSIIPWLCGDATQAPKTRNINRLRCHYVALSRAKGLVCLAIPQKNITDEQQSMLRNLGWNIVVV